MFRFANAEILYALILIPLMVLLYAYSQTQKKKKLRQLGDWAVVGSLMPDLSSRRPLFKLILACLALSLVIVGLARPQTGSKLKNIKRKGIELMIALDVSNSMNARDIQPSRLERAKQAIARLSERLEDDRIGLIVFAGDAYTQLPITTDYASAKMFLSSINTGMVPVQGTSIGKAIRLGMRSFSSTKDMQKAIILITDGENHEDDAVAAATEAAQNGIKIFTIGMGLPQGSPISIDGTGDFLRDKSGTVVISKLNELTLEQIAAAGNGSYVRANNTRVGLDTLFDELNKLDKKEFETDTFADYNDYYMYCFGLALLIMVIDLLISDRRSKWFNALQSFNLKQAAQ